MIPFVPSLSVGLPRGRLARNAGWMFAGQGLSFAAQAIYFVLLARLLGSRQYGTLAGASALVSIAAPYSTMGSGLLALRYISPDHARFREYWGNVLLSTACFGTLLVLGLTLAGHAAVGDASTAILLPLAVGECLCGQSTSAAGQVFQSFERMRVTALLTLLTNLLRAALAGAMLVGLHRATAAQWARASLTVSAIATVTALAAVTTQFGWPRLRPRLFWRRIGEGFVFAVSGSTTSAYNDLDKVMLGHYGMTVANGVYTMAYRVVNIATMPVQSVQAAAFPRFFREGVKGAGATEALARRLLQRNVWLAAGPALALFLCAPLLPRLAGRGFAESAAALRWLGLIPVFRSLHLTAGDAMAGAGYQRVRLASQLTAAAGNCAINLALIPRYGWRGAALASLLTDGGLALLNWTLLLWLRRREGVRSESAEISPRRSA